MNRTVIVDFPDSFKFPKHWNSKNCGECPFNTSIDDAPLCFLTGDGECNERYNIETHKYEVYEHPECPFYGGAGIVKML